MKLNKENMNNELKDWMAIEFYNEPTQASPNAYKDDLKKISTGELTLTGYLKSARFAADMYARYHPIIWNLLKEEANEHKPNVSALWYIGFLFKDLDKAKKDNQEVKPINSHIDFINALLNWAAHKLAPICLEELEAAKMKRITREQIRINRQAKPIRGQG